MLNVTCAIIIENCKILITQRSARSDHPLKWEFPGGKLNHGETLEECIIREIGEELGIELGIVEKMYPVRYNYGFKQVKLFPFVCNIKSGVITLIEHSQFEWVKYENLKNYEIVEADIKLVQHPQNREILKKYLREDMHNTR